MLGRLLPRPFELFPELGNLREGTSDEFFKKGTNTESHYEGFGLLLLFREGHLLLLWRRRWLLLRGGRRGRLGLVGLGFLRGVVIIVVVVVSSVPPRPPIPVVIIISGVPAALESKQSHDGRNQRTYPVSEAIEGGFGAGLFIPEALGDGDLSLEAIR